MRTMNQILIATQPLDRWVAAADLPEIVIAVVIVDAEAVPVVVAEEAAVGVVRDAEATVVVAVAAVMVAATAVPDTRGSRQ